MLTNLSEPLEAARRGSRAVGSFNVYSHDTIRGVLSCAERLGEPVVVAFGAGYLDRMELAEFVSMAKYRAERLSVPVVLHLDHCRDLSVLEEAMEAGFGSVMYDGSHLPFEENVRNSAEVARMAAGRGVSVEAELGSLALGDHSAEGELGDDERFTDPEAAREFVERTKIDALAVSIGTVHGFYKGEPDIRIDILKRIRERTELPLVLHGGSGTPPAILRECIANGIRKINVNTELSQSAVDRIAELVAEDGHIHLSKLSAAVVAAVDQAVEKQIKLFR